MTGRQLGWLTVIGLAGLGTAALLMPGTASHAYGTPQRDRYGKSLIRAMALRDLGLAGIMGATLPLDGRIAAIPMLATAAVSAADLINVVSTRGPRPLWPLTTHLSGVVMGTWTGVKLLQER
jgi:hypothetical protein